MNRQQECTPNECEWVVCNRPCRCERCGKVRNGYRARTCGLCGQVVRVCHTCARSLSPRSARLKPWGADPVVLHARADADHALAFAWPLDYSWRG